VDDVRWTDAYNALLAEWVPASSSIWLETDNHPRRFTYVQTRNERMAVALRACYPDARVESLYAHLAGMRLVKAPSEMVQQRRACEITGAGFVELLPQIKPGMGEWEIEAVLSAAYIRRRARKFSFLPIIASGADTCVLHYISNHKEVQDSELILLDIGAEYGGYAGDMTRTVPANGKFTPRQRAVYEAVLRVQRYAMSIMRPGLEKQEYERLVRVKMAAELVQLGLLTQEEVDAQPENPLCVRKYYMHGTSHSLGIDVHDVGSDTKCFAVGQVWTVEPGIYIPAEKIGIRLETDVLITEDGVEDLIPNAPIEPDDIEAAMRG
jgi:Xaa-Pro aminopeptidase